MSPSKTKQSLHFWFIWILVNYSPLTHLLWTFALSIVALIRSDSSHYYGFASKGNPGFLQHSSGQSPGLTVPATVHTRRSRSLLNACLHVICMRSEIPVDTVVDRPVCPVKSFRLNNRSFHVTLLINRKQDRNRIYLTLNFLRINSSTQDYAFIYSWEIFSLAQMEGHLPLVSNEPWLYVNAWCISLPFLLDLCFFFFFTLPLHSDSWLQKCCNCGQISSISQKVK